MRLIILIILVVNTSLIRSQDIKIIHESEEGLLVELNFNNVYQILDTVIGGNTFQYISNSEITYRLPGEPWLPGFSFQVAIPFLCNPQLKIINDESEHLKDKYILPLPEEDPDLFPINLKKLDRNIYSSNKFFPESIIEYDGIYKMRYARILPILVSPFQYNPVTREIIFHKKLLVQILFNNDDKVFSTARRIDDAMTEDFLTSAVINSKQAISLMGVSDEDLNYSISSWYNPEIEYYKIYLAKEGVYRITFEDLINSNVPIGQGVRSNNIQLFANGFPIPLDIVDGRDDIFDEGDYIQFVGMPPPNTPYSNFNIYNTTNVYWITFQNTTPPIRYSEKNGRSNNYTTTLTRNKNVIHYEQDLIYERLGQARDGFRDNWYWGKSTAFNGESTFSFQTTFPSFPNFDTDSNRVTLKVNMHGMSSSIDCNPDHKAYITITDQLIGNISWDGVNEVTFVKSFYVSNDSVRIYPVGNNFKVSVFGDACSLLTNDEIRINWFSFEYWRQNRTSDNHYYFSSPGEVTGITRFWLFGWQRSNMKIYIPQQQKVILNAEITNDQYESVFFVDTLNSVLKYYCVADDYFLTVDSIKFDVPSDLMNPDNGADYIIITHPDFETEARRLAEFRSNNFPDSSVQNPRVTVIDIFQIYDEFSYGLLDPFAVQTFIKYAFFNWRAPSPKYIVLFGDMSFDYRSILPTSRKNFIPSIPYFTQTYGQAASDNMFAAVVGQDVTPDLAIGRLSCETREEAVVLVDKIINYPLDDSKLWRQNVLLLSSGLSETDENLFGFNDANLYLDSTYLMNNGFGSSKVFRYPTKPSHIPFQGEGPKIREEINKGAVFVNYYGHGGGYQWDLVFLNDDIYLLENENRLPFISSVTCYTAHFDNQNVFGEQFNKVLGRGSIAFFGSSGLTYWTIGKDINQRIFNHVFNNRDYVIGRSILKAKSEVPNTGFYASQIALLTLLGDPVLSLALPDKPDFQVRSSDITFSKNNIIVNDTVIIKVSVKNLGVIFPNDSVSVQLYITSTDSTFLLNSVKKSSFAFEDAAYFTWVPDHSGFFEFTARINEIDVIPEMDFSDNSATNSIAVFNISEPSIIKPIDGLMTDKTNVNFLFLDLGHYLDLDLKYFIEIDTNFSFLNPAFTFGPITPADGLVELSTQSLPKGVYFWRARIFDGKENGFWSAVRSFTIADQTLGGYLASEKILETFDTYNIVYSNETKSLRLNTDLLPPKPQNERYLEDIFFEDPGIPDTLKITSITTDGTYLYCGHIWYYALDQNPSGYSKIYKFGTGNNGTIKGRYYGELPNFYDKIFNQMFYHSDGYIYVPTGNAHWIKRINTLTYDTNSVYVPDGFLRWEDAKPLDGSVYLTSDGKYVYNLTLFDSLGNNKYVLRIFDPSQNWNLIQPYMILTGTSYDVGFSSFFVVDNYLFVTEFFNNNFMRRYDINSGIFEEEWIVQEPFRSFYAWCYDWQNNNCYTSVFRRTGYVTAIAKYAGKYIDAEGKITSPLIGPASEWSYVNYDIINPSLNGYYNVNLFGLNKFNSKLDTIAANIPNNFDIGTISTTEYPFLQVEINFVDSSLGSSNPIELKLLNIDYRSLPEIFLNKSSISFFPDSLLQGNNITQTLNLKNVGYADAQNVLLKFILNNQDTAFFTDTINIKADSTFRTQVDISTAKLIFDNSVKVTAQMQNPEFYTFNNLIENSFFVARDSVKPSFQITFDGREILEGDIISSKPTVVITLEDNSPLPLTPSLFTIVHNNVPLKFDNPALSFNYTPYPNSRAEITWTPELEDGRHVLEVLAKDSSGNFFDSTSNRSVFFVFNNADLLNVYNYPNPFTENTYFTFEIRGTDLPEELRIKIYTIAGRLIREINIPPNQMRIGFNQIYWDGRDEDGDEIANGLYFYKVISRQQGETKTTTQKLAKVK